MDAIPISARPTFRYRRFVIVWQVGIGAQIPDGLVYARRKSRRRSIQERNIRRRSQSPVVDQRRRRVAGATGEFIDENNNFIH